MAELWAARLILAMEQDEVGEENDAVDEDAVTDDHPGGAGDPGPGPWDAAAERVPDPVIAAALLGFPNDRDADVILGSPAALRRLTRRWAVDPPGPALRERATTNSALRRLLRAAGAGSGDQPPPTGGFRIRAMRQHDVALTAADGESVPQSDRWPGGTVVRQRLADGTTAVTVTCAADPLPAGDDAWLVRLADAGGTTRPLLLVLIPDEAGPGIAEGTASWIGQAVVPGGTLAGELDVAGPVRLSSFTDSELGAVPDSVAWSHGPWNIAWRQAARAAGPDSPLYAAVRRATRRT